MNSHLLLLGLNHTIAPVEVRERLAFGRERLAVALVELHSLLAADACACDDAAPEVVILSTCNRTEVYAWAAEGAEGALRRFLAARSGLDEPTLCGYLYARCGDDAAHHLMRVAAGLDSLVIGENEILGQVKEAYEAAHAALTTGPVLSTLFRLAIQAGKRVRSETAIGRAALSVGTIVVEMAQEAFGSLADRTALLIGAGKMSSIAGQALVRAGLRCVLVANRTYERAERLAAALGGRAVRFDALIENLAAADIVICSTGAPHLVLHADDVRRALQLRPQPSAASFQLLVVDLAVPRDADPAIAAIPGVRLADIDDLEALVRANHPLAVAVRQAAEGIVTEELEGFRDWLAARCCAPLIQALRARADAICQAEVEKTLRKLGDLTPRQQEAIAAMARAIANKLLHDPIVHLKQPSDGHAPAELVRVAEALFGLK
ncbi:MAG: glutamyl-tRNA reductase [Anaerolineae bacterium]|nr:glutamyl-tRNA reductase [Anaerolineae bacterium]